ncbi:MAG: hypothetical protein KKA70_10505 [Proteobacteria bacterium]|nr:hypothetical protein [Pseudomonadota bacterium]MBU1716368.1 hypothetical protein [Pseudomonadota bacterium]
METLYFPKITLRERTGRKLLLFFSNITVLTVAEGDTCGAEIFSETGLVSCVSPAPLGDDRGRFEKLVKDLEMHGNEFYSGYLSSISAGINEETDGLPYWALVSELTHGNKEKRSRDQEKDILWQARLILKLTEMLDQDKEVIEAGLSRIIDQESDLFHALKGDDDEDDEELFGSTLKRISMICEQPGKPGIILRAWGHLFLRSQQECLVLAADDGEAIKQLFDYYETFSGEMPRQLCSIDLFDDTRDPGGYLALRNVLQQEAADCLGRFQEALRMLSENNGEIAANVSSLEQESAQFAEFIAAKGQKCGRLTFYLLEKMSLEGLFAKICRFDPKRLAAHRLPASGIVAFLEV